MAQKRQKTTKNDQKRPKTSKKAKNVKIGQKAAVFPHHFSKIGV
jgi:hypothetical protein